MQTAADRPNRPLPTRALAIVGAMIILVIASQVVTSLTNRPLAAPARPAAADPLAPTIDDLDPGSISFGTSDGAANAGAGAAAATVTDSLDLERIHADVTFWGARAKANPDDFVSTNRLGISEIELARTTGDLTAYLAADEAFGLTLRRDPKNAAAVGFRGSVLVSLHRFPDARSLATDVLRDHPDDPVALATLGDASLELGDLDVAADAFRHAQAVAPSAATQARLAHLAFIRGDTATAVRLARSAVADATREGAEGERAAFYQYQLADTLLSTGDRAGARDAYLAALKAQPTSFLALAGLARVAAADGELDEAIDRISAAIAIVPRPDSLARRGDLYTLRGRPGDAKLAAADDGTVEAIAKLAGDAASVYDRTLATYLADHGLEPDRAVSLAQAELAVRKDVYGYDAHGLDAARGRPAEGCRRRDAAGAPRRDPGRAALLSRGDDRRCSRPDGRRPSDARARPGARPELRPAPGATGEGDPGEPAVGVALRFVGMTLVSGRRMMPRPCMHICSVHLCTTGPRDIERPRTARPRQPALLRAG